MTRGIALIKQERRCVCFTHQPLAGLGRNGVGATVVAREFVLEESLGDGPTVYWNKRLVLLLKFLMRSGMVELQSAISFNPFAISRITNIQLS